MKRFAAVIALATLLPLAGCATPYGYSPGAWANYDGDYDAGYDGYDRPITPNIYLGVAGGYLHSNIDEHSTSSGTDANCLLRSPHCAGDFDG